MIVGLRWIGLFSTDPAPVQDSLLDTLAAHLQTRVGYQTGERDLVMLQHKFVIEWADGRAVSTSLPDSSYMADCE